MFSELNQFINEQHLCLQEFGSQNRSYVSDVLAKGIQFTRQNKNGLSAIFQIRKIKPSEQGLIDLVKSTVSKVPQLAELTTQDILELSAQGLALIVESQSGQEWLPAAYLGAENLMQSELDSRKQNPHLGLAYLEMRSSYTWTNGFRLNEVLKKFQMLNLASQAGLLPCAFTDKIPAWKGQPPIESQAVKINQGLNLLSISISALPRTLKDTLTSSCPENRCSNVEGSICPACDCKIWYPQVSALISIDINHINL